VLILTTTFQDCWWIAIAPAGEKLGGRSDNVMIGRWDQPTAGDGQDGAWEDCDWTCR